MEESGEATKKGKNYAPYSMTVMSPLARVSSFPGVALATPETGSLSNFSYKMDVKPFLTRSPII